MFLLLLLMSIVIPFLKSSDLSDYLYENKDLIPYKAHLGKIQFGKCNKKGVIRRLHPTSLLDCAKECLATSDCSAINYRRSWFLCDILDERYESHLDWEKGCIYSVISTWNKSIGEECGEHTCSAGESCYYDDSGGTTCITTYCMDLPSISKAVSSERFGPHRSINHGIRYDCVGENMWAVGPPFAFCRSPGLWDVMFKCKELKYIGCFKDDENRLLKYKITYMIEITMSKCIQHCAGFTYLGLEARHWCLCGDALNYVSYPEVDELRCSMPCSGDNQLMCGNQWIISIYQVGDTDVFSK